MSNATTNATTSTPTTDTPTRSPTTTSPTSRANRSSSSSKSKTMSVGNLDIASMTCSEAAAAAAAAAAASTANQESSDDSDSSQDDDEAAAAAADPSQSQSSQPQASQPQSQASQGQESESESATGWSLSSPTLPTGPGITIAGQKTCAVSAQPHNGQVECTKRSQGRKYYFMCARHCREWCELHPAEAAAAPRYVPGVGGGGGRGRGKKRKRRSSPTGTTYTTGRTSTTNGGPTQPQDDVNEPPPAIRFKLLAEMEKPSQPRYVAQAPNRPGNRKGLCAVFLRVPLNVGVAVDVDAPVHVGAAVEAPVDAPTFSVDATVDATVDVPPEDGTGQDPTQQAEHAAQPTQSAAPVASPSVPPASPASKPAPPVAPKPASAPPTSATAYTTYSCTKQSQGQRTLFMCARHCREWLSQHPTEQRQWDAVQTAQLEAQRVAVQLHADEMQRKREDSWKRREMMGLGRSRRVAGRRSSNTAEGDVVGGGSGGMAGGSGNGGIGTMGRGHNKRGGSPMPGASSISEARRRIAANGGKVRKFVRVQREVGGRGSGSGGGKGGSSSNGGFKIWKWLPATDIEDPDERRELGLEDRKLEVEQQPEQVQDISTGTSTNMSKTQTRPLSDHADVAVTGATAGEPSTSAGAGVIGGSATTSSGSTCIKNKEEAVRKDDGRGKEEDHNDDDENDDEDDELWKKLSHGIAAPLEIEINGKYHLLA